MNLVTIEENKSITLKMILKKPKVGDKKEIEIETLKVDVNL